MTDRNTKFTLGVEAYMSNPPQPASLGVRAEDGRVVAWLEYADVKRALEQFEAMKAIYDRHLQHG